MKTVYELSKALNVNERTIRRWLSDGTISGIRVGKQWRIADAVYNDIVKGGTNEK